MVHELDNRVSFPGLACMCCGPQFVGRSVSQYQAPVKEINNVAFYQYSKRYKSRFR
jgi:hypothetical protein